MLRMSYMPSDFHPVLLILGHKTELMTLADAFDGFSKQGGSLDLNAAGILSTDTKVTLEEWTEGMTEKVGLWPVGRGQSDLIWRLPKRFAWIFANEVANLGSSPDVAGSATLECEVFGEIRAKVSIGEWEEGYLSDAFR